MKEALVSGMFFQEIGEITTKKRILFLVLIVRIVFLCSINTFHLHPRPLPRRGCSHLLHHDDDPFPSGDEENNDEIFEEKHDLSTRIPPIVDGFELPG